jgi:hypothetical protein
MTPNLLRYKSALYRRAYLFSDEAMGYLYHVTPVKNLRSIARQGIVPAAQEQEEVLFLTGPAGIPRWFRWVEQGSQKMKDPWDDDYVAPLEETIKVAVLRTPILSTDQLTLDPFGNRDLQSGLIPELIENLPSAQHQGLPPPASGQHPTWLDLGPSNPEYQKKRVRLLKRVKELVEQAKAYKTQHSVSPEDLEVWMGTNWVPIKQYRSVKAPYPLSSLLGTLTRSVKMYPESLRRRFSSVAKKLIFKGAVYRLALSGHHNVGVRLAEHNPPPTFSEFVQSSDKFVHKSVQILYSDSRFSLMLDFHSRVPEDRLLEQASQKYAERVRYLQGLQGRDAWRVVQIPPGHDPVEHTPLGIYWATQQQSAGIYDTQNGANYRKSGQQISRYRARIDLDHLNWIMTLAANFRWPNESEVQFYPGSSIYVHEVEIETAREQFDPPITINSTRRA